MRFPWLAIALFASACALDWRLPPMADAGREQADAGKQPAELDASFEAGEDAAPTPPSAPACLIDADEDGYGTSGLTESCPSGRAPEAVKPGECDDRLASVHPGQAEICGDGIDNDCSGTADDPRAAERCNEIDDDCDGALDEGSALPVRADVWTQPDLSMEGSNLPVAVTALLSRPQGGGWLMYQAIREGGESEPWVYPLDEQGAYAGGARVQPRRSDGSSVWANTWSWRASSHGRWNALLIVRRGFYPRSFDISLQLFRAEDFGLVSELALASEGDVDSLMPLALSVIEGAQGEAHLLAVYARGVSDAAASTHAASVHYSVAAFRNDVWEQPARRALISAAALPVFLPDASLARVPCREEWFLRGSLFGAEPGSVLQRVTAGSGALAPLGLDAQTAARNLSLWEGEDRCGDQQPAPQLLFSDRQVDSHTLGFLRLDRESGKLKEGDSLAAPVPLEAHQSNGRWFYATLSADSLYTLYEVDWASKLARPIVVSADMSIGLIHPLTTVGRQLFDFMSAGPTLIAAAANGFTQSRLDAGRSALLPNPTAPAAAVTYTLSCTP